mgnify:CR=1 FL=1
MRRAADFESTTPVAAKRSTHVGSSSPAETVVRGNSAIADAKILPFTKSYRRVFINDYGTWFTFYDRDNLEKIMPRIGAHGLSVSASGYIVHKRINGVLTNKGTILEVVV